MMDRLEAMATFAAVVDHGGFSAAARRLNVPLATVSRRVSDLEAVLGVRLLNRSTRQVTLTETGLEYLRSSRRILDDVREAERTAAGEFTAPRGELTLTAPLVFGRMHLTPVITAFLEAYPEVTVRMMLSDRFAHLLEEHIDLAVRIGNLPDSTMVATRLGEIRRVCVASPDYLAAHGAPQTPADLERHACVTVSATGDPVDWSLWVAGQAQRTPVTARLVATTTDAAITAALAGAGITQVFCYQTIGLEQAGRLQAVLTDFEAPAFPASLVYPAGRAMPKKLRAFLDFATPLLRDRLSGVCTPETLLSLTDWPFAGEARNTPPAPTS